VTVQPPPRDRSTPRRRVHRAERARKVALGASVAGFVGLTGWLAVAPAESSATASKAVVSVGESDDGAATGTASTSSSTSSSYGSAVPSSSYSSSASTRTVSRGS